MKKNLLIAIVIIVVVGAFIYYKTSTTDNSLTAKDSVVGCYVAILAKDVYTLKITSQKGESVEGTLVFKNFEKDSSSGTFKGTYKNGILLGDYSFQSEGMNSVMQVIFKKFGNGFARGYGTTNSTGERFTNLNNITYDSAYVFEATSGECATTLK